MRLNTIDYGPHGRGAYNYFYFYNETSLEYGDVLNDEDDSMGLGFQFNKTGTVSGIGLYIIEYQGNPDYAIGFTTISGTPGLSEDAKPAFNPDTHVNTTMYSNSQWQTFQPHTLSSGWNWIDLETPLNVTKGEIAALIITPSGSSIPTSTNFVEINTESTFWNSYPGQFWWSTSYWNKYSWDSPASLIYSDGEVQGFCLIGLPYRELSYPEEWGVEFELPFQATAVGGVFNFYPDSFTQDGPFKITLADSSDGELASITVLDNAYIDHYDADTIHLGWDTATDPVLSTGTTYRLYISPVTSAIIPGETGVNTFGFIMFNEATKNLLPGGSNWRWIERPAPTSGWTYKADHYPWISLSITDIVATGGGAGSGTQANSSYGFIG